MADGFICGDSWMIHKNSNSIVLVYKHRLSILLCVYMLPIKRDNTDSMTECTQGCKKHFNPPKDQCCGAFEAEDDGPCFVGSARCLKLFLLLIIIAVHELLQAKTAAAQALRKQIRRHDQRHWAVYWCLCTCSNGMNDHDTDTQSTCNNHNSGSWR